MDENNEQQKNKEQEIEKQQMIKKLELEIECLKRENPKSQQYVDKLDELEGDIKDSVSTIFEKRLGKIHVPFRKGLVDELLRAYRNVYPPTTSTFTFERATNIYYHRVEDGIREAFIKYMSGFYKEKFSENAEKYVEDRKRQLERKSKRKEKKSVTPKKTKKRSRSEEVEGSPEKKGKIE